MALAKQRIRLKVLIGSLATINDALTGALAQVWKDNDVDVEVGIFEADGTTPAVLTGMEFIDLEIRPATGRSTGVYVQKHEAPDAAELTLANWNAGTHQHHTFALAAADLALPIADGAKSATFWLVIGVVDTGAFARTMGGTEFSVVNGGWGDTGNQLALLGVYDDATVPAGDNNVVIALPGMTTDGFVIIHKATAGGGSIESVVYATDQITVTLTGIAPAGGVTLKYLVAKL
jgi:hypothetical protein